MASKPIFSENIAKNYIYKYGIDNNPNLLKYRTG